MNSSVITSMMVGKFDRSDEMNNPLCMFCAKEIGPDQLSVEHFVPKGLREKGRRPNQVKTVSTHKCCNEAYSSDNEYFRDVMLLEEGVGRHPQAREVQTGAISRKMNKRFGSFAKNFKNVGIRTCLKIRILSLRVVCS